jgi:preprotein translocase subunit SecA
VLLNIIDTRWREHLYEMDYLQEGIYLRSYAQKDPITEYRREAFDMFEELTSTIQTEFVRYIYRVELVRPEQPQRRASAPKLNRVRESHGGEEEAAGSGAVQEANPNQVISDKVPRNAPCPCGSGRKYKKCHGAVA